MSVIIIAVLAALISYGRYGSVFGFGQKGQDETEVIFSPDPASAQQENYLSGNDSDAAANSETEDKEAEKSGAEKPLTDEPEEAASGSDMSSGQFEFPEYAGEPWVVLNSNIPDFTEEEKASFTGESYSELDALGRCGQALALLHRSLMPAEDRGEIGEIRPSGWNQAKYPGIVDSDPPFLYNRCHLIAYALTGQNANEKNLITGTRYMNVEGMFPFEGQVISYLYRHDAHVLYRVTPRFYGDELVARGVEMEAYSVEDSGADICFHVFVFNVQPGIIIDYANGESREYAGS